jgi:hypothetical protein
MLLDFVESDIGSDKIRTLEEIDRIHRIFQDSQDGARFPHPVNPVDSFSNHKIR